MKSPNDYPQIKFRSGPLTETLTARSPEPTNSAFSQVAKQDLSDHYSLLRLERPELTRAEWDVVFQALHGWFATTETAHSLWTVVEALNGAHGQSDVDILAFAEKLRKFSRFECWCIYDTVKISRQKFK